MQNKLCIIASWFLFSSACCAVSPAHALTTAKSATPFMSCMQDYARRGVFFLSRHIAGSAAKTVTNSISHHLFRQDQAAENSKVSLYARKGLSVASSILTQAGISWALMPLLFSRKRHPFQFWLALAASELVTTAVTQRVKGYCLSKVSHKSTKKYLLSLGFAASAVAGLEYLRVKMPYSVMRACTGVCEASILPYGYYVADALCKHLMSAYIFLENLTKMEKASVDLAKLFEGLNRNRSDSQQKWQQVEKEVDAVAGIFADREYSYAQLHANALIPQFFLNAFLQAREAALRQFANLYTKRPENISIKNKLAHILCSASLEDLEYEIAACEELLAREEQTLPYANELATKRKWFDKIFTMRASSCKFEGIFSANHDAQQAMERLTAQGRNILVRLDERLNRVKVSSGYWTGYWTGVIPEIERQVICVSSSLERFSIASTDGQLSELEQNLNDVLAYVAPLNEPFVYIKPQDRLKVSACIKSFGIKCMQILEPKFTFISQQLAKDHLSSEELKNLSRYFQNLNRIMNKGVRPFVGYLDQDGSRQLLEHIFRVQIPQLRATFADAAFALKFKTS